MEIKWQVCQHSGRDGLFVAVLAVVAIPACDKGAESDKVAIRAAQELQQAFDRQGCKGLYEMSEAQRSGDIAEREWLNGCEKAKESLGKWQELTHLNALHVDQSDSVLVEGRAVFTNGDDRQTFWMDSYWKLNGQRATLLLVYLEAGGRRFGIPHLPARPPTRLTPGDASRPGV